MTPDGQPPMSQEERREAEVQRVAALAMALSGTVEYDAGNEIPQGVWHDLYQEGYLSLRTDHTGEAYTVVTDKGDAWLRAAVAGAAREIVDALTPAEFSAAERSAVPAITVTDEMVERGAREAFWQDDLGGHIKGRWTWETIPNKGRENYRQMIRAAFSAAFAEEREP